MKRNRAAVVTTVSTVMLGAGWVAGLVGTALASTSGATTIEAVGTGATVGTSAEPTATAAASASPSATATATASATPAATTPAAVSGTFDGAVVTTRYGSYQAEITVTDGTITAVTMLQSGASDRESLQISGNALPQLVSSVLQQQTYKVSYVSGASYTSQGFEASVQDAMVQAGLA